jgi:hypothetical protein
MAMTLLTTNTESGDATSDFTTKIDSTYKLYIFKFIDINPATDAALFTFNGSIDAGSNYNVTKTSTFFRAIHDEGDSTAALQYMTANDEGQATVFQDIVESVGSGADESAVGELFLFNPSSTVYVKHFYATTHSYHDSDYAMAGYVGGYFNTTDNIDAIQFKMSSGNMDGVIKLYGVG